jgi:GAF domain-containing protein
MAWLARGAELAIDDTGSGYASLRHVLQLCPDFIKLDRSLVDGIDRDRNRQALMNALVAFAGTIGASVIAEGVEVPAELDMVRSAGVACRATCWPGRGRRGRRPRIRWSVPLAGTSPGPPRPVPIPRRRTWPTGWPPRAIPGRRATPSSSTSRSVTACCPARTCSPATGCAARPSGGCGRCSTGSDRGRVTGRCYIEGRELVVDDVTRSPSYLEAIPGVQSEVCVPIRVEGVVVGALNAERRGAIGDVELDAIRAAADHLGDRLSQVGRVPHASAYDRLGCELRALSAERTPEQVRQRLVRSAQEISGLDSALVMAGPGRRRFLVQAAGPLRDVLGALGPADLARLATVVEGMTSCYTAGTTVDHGLIHLAALRRTGVRALAVVPLVALGERLGLLVVANSAPSAFTPAEVEPLELLAAHAALALVAVSQVHGIGLGPVPGP